MTKEKDTKEEKTTKKSSVKKDTKSETVKKTEKKKTTTTKTTSKKKVSSLPKESEEDLIITRQLDINLEEYTYDLEGLVDKVKEELNNEETISEDPFEGEQTFNEIFEENKSFLRKLIERIKLSLNKKKK